MGRSQGENGGCEKFFLFFLQTVFAYVLHTTKKEPTHNIVRPAIFGQAKKKFFLRKNLLKQIFG